MALSWAVSWSSWMLVWQGPGGASRVSAASLPPSSVLCVHMLSQWVLTTGCDPYSLTHTDTHTHTQRGFLMCEVECISLFSCRSHGEHVGIPSPAMRFTSLWFYACPQPLQEGSRRPLLVRPAHRLGYREDGEDGPGGWALRFLERLFIAFDRICHRPLHLQVRESLENIFYAFFFFNSKKQCE